MRVIGIDAALRATGFGVVEEWQGALRMVASGVIRNPRQLRASECLARVYQAVLEWLESHRPDAVAVEGGYYARNVKTAIVLGEVRGVVLAACAARGVPVYEYAPRQAKLAVTGAGGARKTQTARMVATLLGLKDVPQADAADALALAIAHLHRQRFRAGRAQQSV